MNRIDLIVFDMAGTTVQDNHEVEDCFAKTASLCGIEMSEEEIKSIQGWSKRFVFEWYWARHFKRDSAEFTERVESSYTTFKSILESYYIETPVIPTQGCLETFAFLKENNIKIGLSTGFYRKVTNIILEKLGWLEGLNDEYIKNSESALIDISVASDEVEKGRPAPDMILYCMNKLGIEKSSSVIAVGDTPSDIGSGKSANCARMISLSNGTHRSDQLLHFGPDIILEGMHQLPEYLIKEGFLKENAVY